MQRLVLLHATNPSYNYDPNYIFDPSWSNYYPNSIDRIGASVDFSTGESSFTAPDIRPDLLPDN